MITAIRRTKRSPAVHDTAGFFVVLVETKRFELERMALSQVRTGVHRSDKKSFVDNG